jgi:hypothetical protein
MVIGRRMRSIWWVCPWSTTPLLESTPPSCAMARYCDAHGSLVSAMLSVPFHLLNCSCLRLCGFISEWHREDIHHVGAPRCHVRQPLQPRRPRHRASLLPTPLLPNPRRKATFLISCLQKFFWFLAVLYLIIVSSLCRSKRLHPRSKQVTNAAAPS